MWLKALYRCAHLQLLALIVSFSGVIVIDSCLVGGNKCSEISSHKRPRCLGERRRASVHVTSENCFWRATRARPHTLTVVLLLARACTWLHNHMPYFLCNLKSPFSLLISHSLYECAHAIHHRHTHSHTQSISQNMLRMWILPGN